MTIWEKPLMNMLLKQCEDLHKLAADADMEKDTRHFRDPLLEAANTITVLYDELRNCIRALNKERTMAVENRKLQELVRDMFDGMCDHDRCDICPHWQEGYNGCEYHARMRELGVEV